MAQASPYRTVLLKLKAGSAPRPDQGLNVTQVSICGEPPDVGDSSRDR